MYRFLVTASILVLLGFVYLGQRLIPPIWPAGVRTTLWLLLAAMILNLLWLPFKRWRLTGKSRAGQNAAGWATQLAEACAYTFMGFLSLLLFFTVSGEFVRIAFNLLPQTLQGDLLEQIPPGQNLDSVVSLCVFASAISFFIWGRLNVAMGPRYRFVKVVLPLRGKLRRRPRFRRFAHAARKLRIVQVSDLHIGRAIKEDYVRKVVGMINAQQADIACFTGDIGDGNASELRADAAPLKEIQTRYGVYYVPGNHEYYWGLHPWLNEFTALGMKPIINRGEIIELRDFSVFIAGVSDPTAARFAGELPKLPKPEKANLSLLLVHQPLFARSAASLSYDLMLAGHTHGGQYIPWSWIVHLFYRFAKGLYRTGNLLVYVNDGTGYWGAPLRIGTRPEITVLDLYFSEGSGKHA